MKRSGKYGFFAIIHPQPGSQPDSPSASRLLLRWALLNQREES